MSDSIGAIDSSVVQRNVLRWQSQHQKALAQRQGKTAEVKAALQARFNRVPKDWEIKKELRKIAKEKRERWLLRNCRTDLGSVLQVAFNKAK